MNGVFQVKSFPFSGGEYVRRRFREVFSLRERDKVRSDLSIRPDRRIRRPVIVPVNAASGGSARLTGDNAGYGHQTHEDAGGELDVFDESYFSIDNFNGMPFQPAYMDGLLHTSSATTAIPCITAHSTAVLAQGRESVPAGDVKVQFDISPDTI